MSANKKRVVVAFSEWLQKQQVDLQARSEDIHDAAVELQSDPSHLRAERLERHQRVGLDIGHAETRIVLPPEAPDQPARIIVSPTVIGRAASRDGDLRSSAVGKRALMRRHAMDLINPLLVGDDGDAEVWQEFADGFRKLFARNGSGRPWGVISSSCFDSEELRTAKRAIANELFERVVLVDTTFLIALGLDQQSISQRSVIVDLGYRSTRAALMEGSTPRPENCVEIPFGGRSLDDEIRLSLALRYPELLLTSWSLTAIKERLAFVPPVQRRSILSVTLHGAERRLDLTDMMRQNCELLAKTAVKAIRELLARCSSDCAEEVQRNIVLVGGGAELRGLATRVERELHRDGLELATVHKPVNSPLLASKGAYRWAQQLEASQWNIPLFSFGS